MRWTLIILLFLPISGKAEISSLLKSFDSINHLSSQNLVCSTESEADSTRFCQDPYESVCSFTDTHRKNQLAKVKEVSKKIEEITRDKYQESYQLKQDYMKDHTPAVDFKSAVQKIKATLTSEIQGSQFSEADKKKFIDNIQDVEVVVASEFVSKLRTMHAAGERISQQDIELDMNIASVCNSDYMQPLAFAEDTINGFENRTKLKRVIICNGALFTGVDGVKRNVQILMHELAHYFSPYYNSSTYKNLTTCLVQNIGERTLDDAQKGAKDAGMDLKINKANRASYQERVVHEQVNELACDMWAAQGIASQMIADKKSPQEMLQTIRESYGYYCGKLSTGSHPSGKMRIEVIGNNKALRQAMGCKMDIAEKSKVNLCSF